MPLPIVPPPITTTWSGGFRLNFCVAMAFGGFLAARSVKKIWRRARACDDALKARNAARSFCMPSSKVVVCAISSNEMDVKGAS